MSLNAPLKTRINDDWKAAMKSGDKPRKEALSLLLAAIKQKQVDERIELDDTGVVGVIEKMLKQRKDSVTQYEAAKRQDLADAEKFEVSVLTTYMPQGLGAAEIEAIVAAAIAGGPPVFVACVVGAVVRAFLRAEPTFY